MNKLILAGIIILLAAIYWPSFSSPFFQDDALLLRYASPQYFLTMVPPFHYHPVSNQLFYFLSKSIFGMNVTGYHVILFLATSLSLVFVYKLAANIFSSKSKALLTVFFYAFNVSIFANFYWIAISYFIFAGLFFFSSAYFFLQKNRVSAVLSLVLFTLCAGSNELAIFLAPIFIALAWFKNYWPKRLWAILGLDAVFLFLKIFWVGTSPEPEYVLNFSFGAVATLRWYLLRALNLPEGVNRSQDAFLISLFVVLMVILVFSLANYAKSKEFNMKLLVLGAFWFVVGALPFYFLPSHMSAYYLTIAIFGPAAVFAEIIDGKKVFCIAILAYFLMTVRGLDFLSKTHWIILKNTGPIGSF